MTQPTVSIRIDQEWVLSVAEVWPDGPPQVIDAGAVIEAFGRHRNVTGLLHDWNLIPSIEVEVVVPNPHYRQDEALFPEHAQTPTIRSKGWWPS